MRVFAKCLAWLAAMLLSFNASAGSMPYDKAAFDQAVAAGEPVIVHFHADWCPTCRAQAPIVSELLGQAKMKPVKFFAANFDTERTLKKALNVSTQSTFVVFKGGSEVTRSTGVTQRAGIEAVFDKAL